MCGTRKKVEESPKKQKNEQEKQPLTRKSKVSELISKLEIKKCRCNRFVPVKTENVINQRLCGCGRPFNVHSKEVQAKYESGEDSGLSEWKDDLCTAFDNETDACGDMLFLTGNDNRSKYIRVHYQTDMYKMVAILINLWKLPKPKLIISVTGGTQLTMKQNLKDQFRKDLAKVALSTHAWISTGGTNTGVMRYVGEAIGDLTFIQKQKIALIGIANWCSVANNEALIKPDLADPTPVDYEMSILKTSNKKKTLLDPNHTHFILVDNAKLDFGGEIKFRADLEAFIASGVYKKTNMRNKSSPIGANENSSEPQAIPIILVVLGGGANTIETVAKSLIKETPCIFIDGSGESSDIFCHMIKKLNEKAKNEDENFKLDDSLRAELAQLIEKAFKPEKFKKTMDNFESIFRPHNRRFLSAYSMDIKDASESSIDLAILQSLLKAQTSLQAQLKLALMWDRVDIAKRYIFNEDNREKIGPLNEIMFTALSKNKVDFVKLFLKSGFDLKGFLTYGRLLKLYNKNVPADSIFYKYLNREVRKNHIKSKNGNGPVNCATFENIGEAIHEVMSNFYTHKYKKTPYNQVTVEKTFEALKHKDPYENVKHNTEKEEEQTRQKQKEIIFDQTCRHPEADLFMYFILINRPAMAKLFWFAGKNQVSSALLAAKVFRFFAANTDENSDKYNETADDFESLAVGILESSSDYGESKTNQILLRQIYEFDRKNTLQIAYSSESLRFLGNTRCQKLLNKIWYNEIDWEMPVFKLAIAITCPLLAPFLVDYKKNYSLQLDYEGDPVDYYKTERKPHQIQPRLDSLTDNLEMRQEASRRDRKKKKDKVVIAQDQPPVIPQKLKLNILKRFYYFFKTPLVKFVYSQLFYLMFLILFSFVILCDFFPVYQQFNEDSKQWPTHRGLSISILEIILIIWVFNFICDEIKQLHQMDGNTFRRRAINFIKDFPNTIDTLAIVLFLIGMIFRFIPDYNCYVAGRTFYSFSLIFWFFKSMYAYTFFKSLGPKLVMIRLMIFEMFFFLLIVVLFMFAFGVSTQSLMYHNQKLSIDILTNIFFPSFFIIAGEYYTRDTIMTAGECVVSDTNRSITDVYSITDCPDQLGADVSLTIYVLYLLILYILLLNLLIAIFNHTYFKVQNEAGLIWRSQRYNLIREYSFKSMPPPFVIFYDAFSIVRLMIRSVILLCCKKCKENRDRALRKIYYDYFLNNLPPGFSYEFKSSEDKDEFIKWEVLLSEDYYTKVDKEMSNNTRSKLLKNAQNLKIVYDKLNEIVETKRNSFIRLEAIEFKLYDILRELNKTKNPNGYSEYLDPNASFKRQSSRARSASHRSAKKPADALGNPAQVMLLFSERYPKSEIMRFDVDERKRDWSKAYPDYKPPCYTSKRVLEDVNSDIDLTAYPVDLRPVLKFNSYDNEFKLDRKSLFGLYPVVEGLPLNPSGRTGICGRGLLNKFGPNRAIQIIISRFKSHAIGNFESSPMVPSISSLSSNQKFQVALICSANRNLYIPKIFTDKYHNFSNNNELNRDIIFKMFERNYAELNFQNLMNLMNNKIIIDNYKAMSNFDTDNAWIEYTAVNYHDRSDALSDARLNESYDKNQQLIWCDLSKEIYDQLNESSKSIIGKANAILNQTFMP